MYKYGVLISSDLGAVGKRKDTSGDLIKRLLAEPEYELIRYEMVPDEAISIEDRLIQWSDNDNLNFIITSGATGLTDRDVMPEATMNVITRMVPGMAEAIRAYGLTKTPLAMLSRGIVGVRTKTLIINLPGSPKGAQDGMDVLMPILPHAIELVKGQATSHDAGPSHRNS